VLGNDPFERGAAPRPADPAQGAGEAPLPPPAPEATPRAAGAPPSAPAAVAPSARGPVPAPPRAASAPGPAAAGGSPPPDPAALAARAAEAAERLRRLEARADETLAGAEARLAELAGRTGAATYAEEIRELLVRLLPALKDRLKPLATLAGMLASPGRLDPYGRDPRLEEGARPLLDFLFDTWWRVDVRGTRHVPAGAAMVVANHGGALPWDALVLRIAARRPPLGRDLRPLLDGAALAPGLQGTLATRLGAVPASAATAGAVLAEGALVGVFPEGSRAGDQPWGERYRLQRLGRGGFARVAARAGVPIVPCAIVGSEEATAPFGRQGWMAEALGLPLLGMAAAPFVTVRCLPLPSRWSVRFGEPVSPPDRPDDPASVGACAEAVGAALQRMLDEELAARRSVFL
jgi:1-acyl-sn-glycerol-3-phosphate acyltransferase